MWICVRVLPLVAAALVLVGCEDMGEWGNSQRFKEDFHSTYPVNAGATISIENFNGAVEIFGGDQNSVEVSATKYANSKEVLDAIKIDVTASPTSVRIRTIRPSSSSWHGNSGARYTLRVPRHVLLDSIASSNGAVKVEDIDGAAHLRTSNGSIHVTKLHGELEARTSNGAIDAEDLDGDAKVHSSNGRIRVQATHGSFQAETSNGSIIATLTDAGTNWPVKAHSSNGKIELTLQGSRLPDVRAETSNSAVTVRIPAGASARVRANTTHSSATSDFAELTAGAKSKSEIDGTIGSGGPLIDVSSSNGAVRITKI